MQPILSGSSSGEDGAILVTCKNRTICEHEQEVWFLATTSGYKGGEREQQHPCKHLKYLIASLPRSVAPRRGRRRGIPSSYLKLFFLLAVGSYCKIELGR